MAKFNQKDLIVAMREEGCSYREIGEKLGCSEEYARNVYFRAHKKSSKPSSGETCLFCGNPLVNTKGAKPKKFCNDKCCANYHNKKNLHKPYLRICEYCK